MFRKKLAEDVNRLIAALRVQAISSAIDLRVSTSDDPTTSIR